MNFHVFEEGTKKNLVFIIKKKIQYTLLNRERIEDRYVLKHILTSEEVYMRFVSKDSQSILLSINFSARHYVQRSKCSSFFLLK